MPATVQGTSSTSQRRQVYNMLDIGHLIYNGKQERGQWKWEMTFFHRVVREDLVNPESCH